MLITDIITLICAVFLIYRGLTRGFWGSLLGPLALIFASIISFVYYTWTKDMLVSLCIGLFGPFILSWIFRSFLRSGNPENNLSALSRLSGALLSLSWGMAMLIITIILLTLVPPVNKPLQSMHKDISASRIYHLINPFNPFKVNKTTPPVTMKELSQDKRIQDIVNDPQIIDAINRKDYAALLSNPKIAAIMQDPEMIKKMMSVYRMQQAGSAVN